MKTKLTTLLLLIIEFAFAQKAADSVMTVFGGLTNGSLTKEQILKADSLHRFIRSDLKNIDARVLSFTLRANFNGIYAETPNSSNKLSEKQIELVTKYLGINQNLFIENIKVLVNGQTLTTNDIKIKVKGPQVLLFDTSSKVFYKYKSVIDSLDLRTVYYEQFSGSAITLPKKIILGNSYLMVDKDGEVDKNLQVIEYSFRISNSEKVINVNNDKLPTEIKQIIKGLKWGDTITFYNIKAVRKDRKIIEVGNIDIHITN
jgi:hypothetical protein